MNIERITDENLKEVTPTMLADESFVAKAQNYLGSIEAFGSAGLAMDVYFYLTTNLVPVAKTNPKMVLKYVPILAGFRLLGLRNVKDPDKADFIRLNIVTVLRANLVDVFEHTEQLYAAVQYDPQILANYRKIFTKALEEASEPLGRSEIFVGKNRVPPLAKNWLADFNQFSALGPKKTVVDELQYLNQSPNVKILTAEEKEILKRFLHFYNWIRFVNFSEQRARHEQIDRAFVEDEGSPAASRVLATSVPQSMVAPVLASAMMPAKSTLAPTKPAMAPPEAAIAKPAAPKPAASPFDLTAVSGGEHQLDDILERAALRSEAGLEISPEDADMIIALIKQNKKRK